ncbi:Acetylornithine deacetylase/Succinyl-diaminopimelate desuccinylase [Variovorax sp. 770b2]|nr:Acetylornithine deacetylase/Succinyl-diaminopimelate desuccinylase [Variovorax sp. 770b2]
MLAALDADQAHHIAFLQEFVRAPSPNPPGDTQLAAKVVLRYLSARGVPASVVAPRADLPNVVSDFEGAHPGPRLIFNGHMDVFPVGAADGWTRDPWSGDIADGHMHGRGVTDMKAGTAASIIAYTYLHERRQALNGSLGLTAVSDEETGGCWGSRWLLQNDTRWHGDCMINAEPGGISTIRFAEKGTLRLTFTVKTAGAHGAYLHKSESASRIAASLICELAAIEDMSPKLPPELVNYLAQPDVCAAADAAMGPGAAAIIARPTLNIGTIHAGLKVNMIPDSCAFEADIRIPMGLSTQDVMDKVLALCARHPQVSVAVQEAASNPSASSAHDHPMVGILARNAQSVTGVRPLALPSLGATDCKFWRYQHIPAFIFGPTPKNMAAPNESVDIGEFLAVIKTHALAAWEFLGGDPV